MVSSGLKKHGIDTEITHSKTRMTDIAVIMGPNLWKGIESDGGEYIILNRKFLGFGERDVHENCSISWNGFNGMGIFCVDENSMSERRLEKYIKTEEIDDWDLGYDKYLLCEQSDVGRSKKYTNINEYYQEIRRKIPSHLLKTRKKNTLEKMGQVEFIRALRNDLSDVRSIFSLNSTVSVESIILGKGVITEDVTNPCYGVCRDGVKPFDRTRFLTYLAHCQWHVEEIMAGEFFKNMTSGAKGPRLHEITK